MRLLENTSKCFSVNSSHSKFKKWLTWEEVQGYSYSQGPCLVFHSTRGCSRRTANPESTHWKLSSTNRTSRKCSGKSACVLQNWQNGCVYLSHFRFLPETKHRGEMWNVNEVPGVGLIQTQCVTQPCSLLRGQRRNEPGGCRRGAWGWPEPPVWVTELPQLQSQQLPVLAEHLNEAGLQ